MTLFIGARDVLDAVTETDIAVHGDAEISDGDFRRALEASRETSLGSLQIRNGFVFLREPIRITILLLDVFGLGDHP